MADDEAPIHDLSILSPRYRASSTLQTYPRDDDPQSMHVGDTPLVLREGYKLTTEKVGQVPSGTPVKVMEVRQGDGAQMRARVCYVYQGWLTREYKEGWLTSVQEDGTHLLVAPKLVEPAPLPPPSFLSAYDA